MFHLTICSFAVCWWRSPPYAYSATLSRRCGCEYVKPGSTASPRHFLCEPDCAKFKMPVCRCGYCKVPVPAENNDSTSKEEFTTVSIVYRARSDRKVGRRSADAHHHRSYWCLNMRPWPCASVSTWTFLLRQKSLNFCLCSVEVG